MKHESDGYTPWHPLARVSFLCFFGDRVAEKKQLRARNSMVISVFFGYLWLYIVLWRVFFLKLVKVGVPPNFSGMFFFQKWHQNTSGGISVGDRFTCNSNRSTMSGSQRNRWEMEDFCWKSRPPQRKAMWTHFDYRLWEGKYGSTWDPSSCDFCNPIMTHCFSNLLPQLLNSLTAGKNIWFSCFKISVGCTSETKRDW